MGREIWKSTHAETNRESPVTVPKGFQCTMLFNKEGGIVQLINRNTSAGPLLGVSIDGPNPLGKFDLRFSNGVTVLYGLNGIGKSRLLGAIDSALSGKHESDNTWIHIQLQADSLDEAELGNISDPLVLRLRSLLEFVLSLGYRDLIGDSLLEEQCATDLLRHILGPEQEEDAWVTDVLSQGVLSLQPAGVTGHEWDCWISGLPDDRAPQLELAFRQHCEIQELAGRQAVDSNRKSNLSRFPVHEEELAAQHATERERLGFSRIPFPEMAGNLATSDRPYWRPIPLVRIGRMILTHGFSIRIDDAISDSLSQMVLQLAGSSKGLIESADQKRAIPSESTNSHLIALSQDATRLVEYVLADNPPVLHCDVEPWGIFPPIQWKASDAPSGLLVRIDELGTGRSRWAMAAALLASADRSVQFQVGWDDVFPSWMGSVLLVDEPESGLHSTAISTMFEGLHEWADSRSVFVASHSPSAFQRSDVELVHVVRDVHGLITTNTSNDLIGSLFDARGEFDKLRSRSLGLEPSDVIPFLKRIVLVEGEHDRAVLKALVTSDELRAAQSLIIPLRGTNHVMSIVDAQFLFDFTDADILIVLDNVSGEIAESSWKNAKVKFEEDRANSADEELRRLRRLSEEGEVLAEFCAKALRSGRAGRIDVYGLSKPDILDYLPVKDFVPSADSWEQLRGDWDGEGSFKQYLKVSFKAKINSSSIARSASGLDCLHPDFSELIARTTARPRGRKR